MSDQKTNTDIIGGNITTILFLIFLTLKLTGHIDWSWWWVTAPLWIPAAITLGILVLAFCVKTIFK